MTCVGPTSMAYNKVKENLAQVHRCIGANVKQQGGKVTGKGGDMLCGVPIA